jgi:DNA-directed RNA polymerase subunit RPC12/RpoP
MSCASCQNKINTDLRCVNCNRSLTLRHDKNMDALKAAKLRKIKCTKCQGTNFIKFGEHKIGTPINELKW